MQALTFSGIRKYLIFILIFLFTACQEAGEQNDAGVETDDKTDTKPAVNNSLPNIIGTSWDLLKIYTRGEESKGDLFVYPEYLFCKSGRWEAHTDSNGMGQMGTYTVEGDQLILVHDGADKLTAKYTMTWNDAGKYLELDNGELIFRLRFKIAASC